VADPRFSRGILAAGGGADRLDAGQPSRVFVRAANELLFWRIEKVWGTAR